MGGRGTGVAGARGQEVKAQRGQITGQGGRGGGSGRGGESSLDHLAQWA